jgi:hypothetical protein
MAVASPRAAKVTTASQIARPCPGSSGESSSCTDVAGGIISASRMMRSSVSTASTAYFPTAVSPRQHDRIHPIVTALAASLTSARVGRGSFTIDSSTCVATITGMSSARARRVTSFCTRGTRSSGNSEPEVSPGHHHRIRFMQDLIDPRDRLRTFELGDQRHRRRADGSQDLPRLPQVRAAMDKAQRDHVHTNGDAKLEVFDVLGRQGRARQRYTRRVDPLVLAKHPAVHHRR